MNRVSIPNHCGFFILVLLSALFSSCDDDRLSEAIQGTWNTQYNLTSNDQSVDSVNETLVFKKGNNDDTSGTLVETKRYISKNYEYGDNTYDFVLDSYVEGKWEIIAGDLYVSYDVSTLRVSVEEKSLKVHYSAYEVLSSDILDLVAEKNELEKQIQKSCYSDMFDYYHCKKDESYQYSDLEINGNSMSFKDSEQEEYHYYKQN